MNFILFGPPGVGKSTLIGHLKLLGMQAVDLEDINSRMRYQLPNMVDNTFLGAADLDPKRKYANAKKVLLLMTQKSYDKRRASRDRMHPDKASQRHHEMAEWDTDDYDYKLNVSQMSELRTAQNLMSLMKEGKFLEKGDWYGNS